ncbi:MAG: UvrD-helicase domain-containing protein [Firmicutes bacterium]|nr:UvrD-helicase domain-containing protein [Bacillota bacterium]
MKKINWTKNQQSAIGVRGQDMLVSASAGSGKTTVMIERIAQMIVDGSVGMDEVLVLTFTNASASDMRLKLRRRLEEFERENSNLQSQIDLLPMSSIGTFHKFCGDLVRTYFNIAGVDPAFAIMEESDSSIVKNEILDELIAKYYERATLAIDTFCASRRTTTLKDIIMDVAKFLESRDDVDGYLDNIALKSYEGDCALGMIVGYYKQAGEYFDKKFKNHLMTAEHEGVQKIIPFVEQCVEISKKLCGISGLKCLQEVGAMSDIFTTLKAAKEFSDYEIFKGQRTDLKEIVKKVRDNFSDLDKRANEYDKKIIEQIIFLVREFIRAYAEAKFKKGVLDFSDLERFALKILESNEIVNQLKAKYKYIFVDEYQDTNPVQEGFLSRLGGHKNIFMVGDIKQSIYGFRGCESTIFADKMTDFEKNLSGKVVELNENFRSNPTILDFINRVFGKVMRCDIAGIDYTRTSQFALGEPYPSNGDEKNVEIIVLDTQKDEEDKKEKLTITKPYDIKQQNNEVEDELRRIEAQSAVIASRISEILGKQIWDERGKKFREVTHGDIVVLGRSGTHLGTLAKTLRSVGIDCMVERNERAVELFEIATLNNFLFAVSNFYNDVPLVLTMQSFIFGFSANDLAQIKIHSNGEKQSFYKQICRYIEGNGNELSLKLRGFIAVLGRYNEVSKRHTVAEILDMFVVEFLVCEKLLLVEGGSDMVANVNKYRNILREAMYGRNLSRYLYLVENEMLDIEIGSDVAGSCVQLMTMHKSKGLEFPIVFLFDVGARFSNADLRKFLVISKEFGITIHSSDIDEYVKRNSLARMAAVILEKRIQVAEEMRLLYVAMTRAKNKLIIIGASSGLDTIADESEDFQILGANNYFDFLFPTILRNVRECDFKFDVTRMNQIEIVKTDTTRRVLAGKADSKMVAELKDRFHIESASGVDVVLKNSVTSLTKNEEEFIDIRPRKLFTTDRGADYGTKFHNIMQNVDFGTALHEDKNIQKCVTVLREFLRGYTIMREVPFLQKIERDGVEILVQGVIDLMAVSADDVIMIDYKTTNASESRLVELYAAQLGMYANAISIGHKKKVKSYIYSTVHGKLIGV